MWNDNDKGNPNYCTWRLNLKHSHFVHHKSHMGWPGIEAVTNPLSHDMDPG